jgi:murein DD-endopeptidase MepM/ murein hydrolase activator NlpD
MIHKLANVLYKNTANCHRVVDFDPVKDKLLLFDFTSATAELTPDVIADTALFSKYISKKLADAGATFGIGGYDENRVLYKRSSHFETPESARLSLAGLSSNPEHDESRSIHLGIDIWGAAGTKVYAPLGGVVHSFAFNDHFGDYGATIILQHQLETINFYTLYGHLSLADIAPLQEGAYINRGEAFAHFGAPAENGNWPPHLHFQVIESMDYMMGDYPGVCKPSDRGKFLDNCPNPDLILGMMQYAK